MMRIFITGSTGFIGSYLSSYLLNRGHTIVSTGTSLEHKSINHKNFIYITADTTMKGSWQNELKDVDAVINLAGRTILKRWSTKYKSSIYNSRILTTRNLVEALPMDKEILFCTASATGYYGNRADEILVEDFSPGNDFLAKVCIDWEKEAFKAKKKGVRVVAMRFGFVLGKKGRSLGKLLTAFRFFVGGSLGNGMHWLPWIHIDDLTSAIVYILENRNIKGSLNFCAPNPVRYKDFAKTIGKILKRPAFFSPPAFIVRLVMGELGQSLLGSNRGIPEKLLRYGFKFKYPDISGAIYDIVKK